jgi:hypothetical protein
MESTTAAANNGSIRNHTNGLNGHMKKKKPQSISNGWYTEIEPSWPGQSFSLALEVGDKALFDFFLFSFLFELYCI